MGAMTIREPYLLPVRVTHDPEALGKVRIKRRSDEPDAGWSTVPCRDRAHALEIMAQYPAARMPSWARIEDGAALASGGLTVPA